MPATSNSMTHLHRGQHTDWVARLDVLTLLDPNFDHHTRLIRVSRAQTALMLLTIGEPTLPGSFVAFSLETCSIAALVSVMTTARDCSVVQLLTASVS